MPRKLRVEYPGAIYHVMSRGNNRLNIVRDDKDRARFLATLAQACAKTGWQIHAWCLMRNHFHLVIETPQPNLVAGMKWLKSECRAKGMLIQFFPRLFLSNGDELFGGAEEDGVGGYGGSGEGESAELIGREDGKPGGGGDDKDVSGLAGEVETIFGHDGRGAETLLPSADALFVIHFAGRHIEAGDHSVIQTTPEQIADDDRSLNVIPFARMAPGKPLVGPPHLWRGDIAGGFRAHDAHRTEFSMAARENNQTARLDGRGYGNIPAFLEAP